ncbi:hypothetical protein GPA24_13230 [Aromatoleum bremense]|uniref:Uncharacterized protein n=1 Tax=Aromatoleum bremense TaxID=76115 RepID=A0ABX1NYF8_9RHOO|nr:hypothetical protein [Aromatoleum bremense]
MTPSGQLVRLPLAPCSAARILPYAASAVRVCGSARHAGHAIGIGAVRSPDRSPPTPPGMRVRTGRFEQLRLGEPRHAEPVEVAGLAPARAAGAGPAAGVRPRASVRTVRA